MHYPVENLDDKELTKNALDCVMEFNRANLLTRVMKNNIEIGGSICFP